MSVKKSYAKTGRLGFLCIMICLLVVPLSGCGERTASTPETATGESATITFACNQSDEAYYEEMVQKFNEQYPHITVELHPYQRDSEGQVTADDADVLISRERFLRNLYTQGDLMDLQPLIEGDQSLDLADFHPGAMALLSDQGSTWAIPAGLDMSVMYYNQNLFDQYKVPYPEIEWTLDDFLDAAVTLRDPDTRIYGYTPMGNAVNPAYGDASLFILQQGGQLFDDLLEPTRPTFDDPLVVEALEWYARLYHEYDVALTPEEARKHTGDWPNRYAFHSNVYSGKIGMWILPFSERGGSYWPVEWVMQWGMVPLPQGSQSVTLLVAEGYAISSKTPHLEACQQWIAFLSKEMPYRLIPARQSLLESTEYEQLVGSDFAAVVRASMANVRPNRVIRGMSDELDGFIDLFREAVNNIVSDDWPPQEAMDWAQGEARTRIGP
jgi:ABC-type glycerol-3-phosphate transport system substrate-binding protein